MDTPQERGETKADSPSAGRALHRVVEEVSHHPALLVRDPKSTETTDFHGLSLKKGLLHLVQKGVNQEAGVHQGEVALMVKLFHQVFLLQGNLRSGIVLYRRSTSHLEGKAL